MALSEREKRKIIQETLVNHFPGLSAALTLRIIDTVLSNFMPNYSPIPAEQESPTAVGSGVSLCDFTISVAEIQSRRQPVGIDDARFFGIIRGTSTM